MGHALARPGAVNSRAEMYFLLRDGKALQFAIRSGRRRIMAGLPLMLSISTTLVIHSSSDLSCELPTRGKHGS